MEKNELRGILGSLLFMSTEPLTVSDLKKIIDGVGQQGINQRANASGALKDHFMEGEAPTPQRGVEGALPAPEIDPLAQIQQMQNRLKEEVSKGEIRDCLLEMTRESLETPGRGFELVEVAKGFQYRTRPEVLPFVKALYKTPPNRLSAPALETLAMVAYQQPVSRAKVEEIRGVESGSVLRTLMERNLVRVVGRSEEPGRPILYGTTVAFLEIFGLQSLSDLPTLKDLELTDQGSPSPAGGADEITESSFEEANDEPALEGEDEGSHELIEDLENSLRSLRDLEKNIFAHEEEKSPAAPALPAASEENLPVEETIHKE
ncbi:MAG: SMC-Scp complex subunit ScpB [Deltaproteobacteria bacterium]|nr:SMC-Scp complex subunit ScpB [Deltaproteobacteria bacterium]